MTTPQNTPKGYWLGQLCFELGRSMSEPKYIPCGKVYVNPDGSSFVRLATIPMASGGTSHMFAKTFADVKPQFIEGDLVAVGNFIKGSTQRRRFKVGYVTTTDGADEDALPIIQVTMYASPIPLYLSRVKSGLLKYIMGKVLGHLSLHSDVVLDRVAFGKADFGEFVQDGAGIILRITNGGE